MKFTTERNRIKRTLTALLLMFVLSFGTVFAGTESPSGDSRPVSGEPQVQTGTEEPAKTEEPAETAPKVGKIIQKGKYYYYRQANGKIRKKAGFITLGNKRYYTKSSGRIVTGKSFKVKRKHYRASKKGVIKKGVYKWKGKLNYSDEKGVWKKSAGFVRWDGKRYYVQKGGTIITDNAFVIKNLPYIADEEGCVKKIPVPAADGNPVMAVAKEQVGIMTGKTYWTWYFKTKFRDCDRTPWCGAFVAWCYNEAGCYDKVKGISKFGNLGYVPSYSKFANNKNKWINTSDAHGGDIIVFGRNIHVGLVEFIYDDYIFTIEGNAGPTAMIRGKPGAVVRRVRKINDKAILGVIRVM